ERRDWRRRARALRCLTRLMRALSDAQRSGKQSSKIASIPSWDITWRARVVSPVERSCRRRYTGQPNVRARSRTAAQLTSSADAADRQAAPNGPGGTVKVGGAG